MSREDKPEMDVGELNLLARLTEWLRGHPARAAASVAVVVGALFVGGLTSAVLNLRRETADNPSPPASSLATASHDSSTHPTLEAPAPSTALPNQSASPTPQPIATASPSPSPTPQPDPYELHGTWESLTPMPDGDVMGIAATLALPSDQIAVFRYERNAQAPSGRAPVAIYDPISDTWRSVAVGPEYLTGYDEQYAIGIDGRMYRMGAIIDPSHEPWTYQRSRLLHTGYELVLTVVADAQGLLYVFDPLARPHTQLVRIDPRTGDQRRLALGPGGYTRAHFNDGVIYAFGAVGPDGLASFDLQTETWTVEGDLMGWPAGIGPDGRVYAKYGINQFAEPPDLWAWDPAERRWLHVQPPALDEWDPNFVSADGRLFAIDERSLSAFTPAE